MKSFVKRFKFALILIPLALFISFLDEKILQGFLASSEIPDHYIYIGSLVVAISILIFAVLRFEKNVNS